MLARYSYSAGITASAPISSAPTLSSPAMSFCLLALFEVPRLTPDTWLASLDLELGTCVFGGCEGLRMSGRLPEAPDDGDE